MRVTLERGMVDALCARFPRFMSLNEELRFGNTAELALMELDEQEFDFLVGLHQAGGAALAQRGAQLFALRSALAGSSVRFGKGDLEAAVPALARYLLENGIRGWLFTASLASRPLPYGVTRVDFTPASSDESGKVLLELKANAKAGMSHLTIRISESDVVDKTIGEVLAAKGFVKETAPLIATYDETCQRYLAFRERFGAQFSGTGIGFFAEDPGATHRQTDWSRKELVVLSSSESPARLVNDEQALTQRNVVLDAPGDVFGVYLRKAAKSSEYDNEREVAKLAGEGGRGLFTQLPVHPLVFMFHLELHHHVWVHASDITPYVYHSDLKEKLILPEEQTDLIDILTAEMDLLMEDVVAGKSGGTTVLCAGPPGVGKTLTAEVYSEIIRRPLYRVHSGQLGLSVAAMETALKQCLQRAQRWGAVMLIDEADVYIKRREDDMTMNAVVGVFLRVLEYFNGLLFLTTNRVDDIDEAIVSRCIALIRYNAPDAEARQRIWRVMLGQFALGEASPLVDELVHTFPTATGRDIKGLTKLVAKYCQHKGVAPTLDVFRRCSIFRAMEQAA